MNKETIASTNAPPAIGPYSPSIKLGDALFLSGQLGIDSAMGKPSVSKIIPLGLQHVLASAMGIVAPAMIIAGVCGLTKVEETMLI